LVDVAGKLDMRYQHVNNQNQLMTGICTSTPEILPNGKIRLHEKMAMDKRRYEQGRICN